MIFLQLFWEYFKIGLFSIGGGMATIPFLYDVSARTGWFTHAQLADMIAVSESTPGPIGVNMATYVGFITRGIPGAVAATVGLILPSIIVILLIAAFLKNFCDNKYINSVFYGLRPASAGLIAAAGLTVASTVFLNIALFKVSGLFTDLLNWQSLALGIILLILTRWFRPTKNLHPIIFILFSAVVGIVFNFAGA